MGLMCFVSIQYSKVSGEDIDGVSDEEYGVGYFFAFGYESALAGGVVCFNGYEVGRAVGGEVVACFKTG